MPVRNRRPPRAHPSRPRHPGSRAARHRPATSRRAGPGTAQRRRPGPPAAGPRCSRSTGSSVLRNPLPIPPKTQLPDFPMLDALPFFEAAARLGSFMEAGAELGVTAAAVAYRVKSLERYLRALRPRALCRAIQRGQCQPRAAHRLRYFSIERAVACTSHRGSAWSKS